MDGLIVSERKIGRNIFQILNPLFEQLENFFAATVKRKDAGFRQERPTAVMQRTSVRIVAVRADLDFRMCFCADDPLHFAKLFLHVTAQAGDRPGDIFEREILLRVNRAMPDKFTIDVGQKTFPQFDAGTGQHIRLKRDVGQMDFFLQAGGGFYLDQIPSITGNGNQDVGPGVAAIEYKRRFV